MKNIVMNVDLVAIGIFLFAISYCFDLIRRQFNAYTSTKQKFKLFAIRDKLALLVISGELKETSKEFRVLRDAINYSISQVDDLSVRKATAIAINGIEKKDVIEFKAENTINIAHEYFLATREMIIRNSRFELFIFSMLHKLFCLKSDNENNPNHAVEVIDEKQKILHSALAA